jgi:hypothetical protein
VKVEPGVQSITILNDKLDMDYPLQATPAKTPSRTTSSLDPPIESSVCPSKTFSQPGLKEPNGVVDYLKKLRASNGSRKTLKGLDYDVVKLLRVDFLPPVFNGDIVFELPPMGSSVGNSQVNSW